MKENENTNFFVRNTKIFSGEAIKVKTHSGEVVERFVWEDAGDVVFVCTRRVYDMLKAGFDAPLPIGFPKSSVVTG